jgi:phospholipid transport system substrate-binding protein
MPVLALLLGLLAIPAAHAQSAGPTAVVERLHATLLQVMQRAQQLGYAGRLKTLSPVLDSVYDYGAMTKSASGSYWKQISPQDQSRLTRAFADMSASTYAARFDDYGGERFVTVGAKDAPGGGVLVQTQLEKTRGEPIKLDYLVKQAPSDGWRIVDVFYMGGISEVANQRSQFLSVLKAQGPEQLIAALEQKAQQQAAAK